MNSRGRGRGEERHAEKGYTSLNTNTCSHYNLSTFVFLLLLLAISIIYIPPFFLFYFNSPPLCPPLSSIPANNPRFLLTTRRTVLWHSFRVSGALHGCRDARLRGLNYLCNRIIKATTRMCIANVLSALHIVTPVRLLKVKLKWAPRKLRLS